MKHFLIYVFLLLALVSCKPIVFLMTGTRFPKVENRATILKYLNDQKVDTSIYHLYIRQVKHQYPKPSISQFYWGYSGLLLSYTDSGYVQYSKNQTSCFQTVKDQFEADFINNSYKTNRNYNLFRILDTLYLGLNTHPLDSSRPKIVYYFSLANRKQNRETFSILKQIYTDRKVDADYYLISVDVLESFYIKRSIGKKLKDFRMRFETPPKKKT